MKDIKSKVYALAKLCINALSTKVEEPRQTINDIKFVLEITDEIVFNLPEYPIDDKEQNNGNNNL